MPTFKAYLSGGSGGVPGGRSCPSAAFRRPGNGCCHRDGLRLLRLTVLCCRHAPSKRGEITGWTADAVRRHTRWLYSVDVTQLDGLGDGVTLTLRDVPSDVEWTRLVKIFLQRVNRLPGLLRWHAVVEWQRRGAPHLHLAVYWSRTADNVQAQPRAEPPPCNTGVVPVRMGRCGQTDRDRAMR